MDEVTDSSGHRFTMEFRKARTQSTNDWGDRFAENCVYTIPL